MKRSTCLLVLAFATLVATAAHGAKIDMKDPRRAVGTEDGVRIDAQLVSEAVSTGAAIGVTVQINNSSPNTIAVADKVCEASYDDESRTITLNVGSEVPMGGELPHLVMIRPGEKKTFTAGASVNVSPSLSKQRVTTPAFVQVKVNVLRDVTPFAALMERAKGVNTSIVLSDSEFDEWLNANAAIELNVIPVRYRGAQQTRASDASQR